MIYGPNSTLRGLPQLARGGAGAKRGRVVSRKDTRASKNGDSGQHPKFSGATRVKNKYHASFKATVAPRGALHPVQKVLNPGRRAKAFAAKQREAR